jgi:competence protein ComEC
VQLGISLALIPLLGVFGLPVSAAAPLINLVLVPVFGFLVVPVALLGVALMPVVPGVGEALLRLLGGFLDILQLALQLVSQLTASGIFESSLHPGETAVLLIGIALLLFPPGFPLRWLAVPVLAGSCLPRAPLMAPGDFQLHVLDVGQGLSTVVETRGQLLVFDTGPAYPSGFSTADAVLLPFLRFRGHAGIDRLVLSHGDIDHAGGAEWLQRSFPVDSTWSGELDRVAVATSACRRDDSWFWDGVRFRWLHPANPGTASGNNASCVLEIDNGAARVLLTGDIEAAVERQLVTRYAGDLRSDIVIAPHHGSRSSSTEAFVGELRPAYAVFSSGWANRYGFPHDEVRDRWHRQGAVTLNTAYCGTISFVIDARDGVQAPTCERVRRRRFWHHAGGSAAVCHAVSSTVSQGRE